VHFQKIKIIPGLCDLSVMNSSHAHSGECDFLSAFPFNSIYLAMSCFKIIFANRFNHLNTYVRKLFIKAFVKGFEAVGSRRTTRGSDTCAIPFSSNNLSIADSSPLFHTSLNHLKSSVLSTFGIKNILEFIISNEDKELIMELF
jgi:hypothetical protein